jgi:hypothetical protein
LKAQELDYGSTFLFLFLKFEIKIKTLKKYFSKQGQNLQVRKLIEKEK